MAASREMNIRLAIFIVTLPCLVACAFSCIGWRHEYLLWQLEKNGVETQALVAESNVATGSGRLSVPAQLVYQFSYNGQVYKADTFVSGSFQQALKAGDNVGIKFLPDSPQVCKPINAPKFFFEFGSRVGLILATAYTLFGLFFFFFAHWKLHQIEKRKT